MIRDAKFADIPRLAALMEGFAARSVYAGRATLNLKATKALFVNALQRHGGQHEGATFAVVAERDGQVAGFLLGVLSRVYHIFDELSATDLFFCCEGAEPRDPSRMLDAFLGWAAANPRVIEVRMGANDVLGDWRRTARLYQRKGLALDGVTYRKDIQL